MYSLVKIDVHCIIEKTLLKLLKYCDLILKPLYELWVIYLWDLDMSRSNLGQNDFSMNTSLVLWMT